MLYKHMLYYKKGRMLNCLINTLVVRMQFYLSLFKYLVTRCVDSGTFKEIQSFATVQMSL